MINELKLDLACGDAKREGYKGVDIAATNSTDYVVDLQKYPWPIESESAEEVNCSHYLEHIPHLDIKGLIKNCNSFDEFKESITNSKDGLINFFNELYRILKPNGQVHIVSPYWSSIRAFGDPTHERYICDWSFLYVNKKWREDNKLEHYGLNCDFDVKISYYINNDMTLKSEEIRNKAFKHDLNSIDDIMVELTKK